MRKITALLLSMLFILSACKPAGSGTLPENDGDGRSRSFVHGSSAACATDSTVYFLCGNDGMLRYTDKASGITGPLCGKPECAHNDAACNASVGFQSYGLSAYNGRLYWVGAASANTHCVFSCAYDGTDRQTVRELDGDLVPDNLTDRTALFYRGCVYIACGKQEVLDGGPRTNHYVYAYPLDPKEEGFVILDEESPSLASDTLIQPYEGRLYIITHAESGGFHSAIRCWDPQARELETLYEGAVPYSSGGELWVMDDGILIYGLVANGTAGFVRNIYKYDFESGELGLLFPFTSEAAIINVGLADNLIVGNTVTEAGELAVLVRDFEGQVVLDAAFQADWAAAHPFLNFSGADGTRVYFYELWAGQQLFAAVPLVGGEVRLLWNGLA